MQLPIPSLNKQKEIVAEYNTIVNRIKLNEQLNRKLEETAQAIYKQWFVDFEFPDENGNPYKLSGGQMVRDVELEQVIPDGWKSSTIGEYVTLCQGLCVNATTAHLIKNEGIPLLRITDLINNTKKIFIDSSVSQKNIATKEDIIVSRTGQVGLVFKNKEGVVYNNCFKVTPDLQRLNEHYLFWFLKRNDTYNAMVELASGSSAQADLTHSAFRTLRLLLPKIKIQNRFSKVIKPIEEMIDIYKCEFWKLEEIKEVLLSKMTTIDTSKVAP